MSGKTYKRKAVPQCLCTAWLCALCALCIAAGLQPSRVSAQTASNQGHIAIQSASLRKSAVGLQLVATADIQLSPEMRQGLNSGVPLQFIVDFRIKRNRPYWFDDTLLEHQHRLSLIYYELTRHYRLQSLTTGESGNYRSLLTALETLGRLQGIVVSELEEFDSDMFDSNGSADAGFNSEGSNNEASGNSGRVKQAKLYGLLNVRLDDNALPLPLQPLLSSTWKLASEDFAWSIN